MFTLKRMNGFMHMKSLLEQVIKELLNQLHLDMEVTFQVQEEEQFEYQ